MNAPRKVLIFGGLTLAAFGMLYGLHYAIFVEHQTLDRMGGSLAAAFVHAAEGHLPEADSAIESYASTKYDYVRQVDAHSHWIGLAMLLILMGVIFDQVAFSLRIRFWIAITLLAGSVVFPLGVVLQTLSHNAFLALVLTVVGSALVTIALAAVAWGLAGTGVKSRARLGEG
jgi:hypothetical protein